MSRSKRQPIIKDHSLKTAEYWRRVRRTVKLVVKAGKTDNIPNPKTLINDYDYSDYKLSFLPTDKYCKKAGRK